MIATPEIVLNNAPPNIPFSELKCPYVELTADMSTPDSPGFSLFGSGGPLSLREKGMTGPQESQPLRETAQTEKFSSFF